MPPTPPAHIGNLSAQAAIFIYKNDSTAPDAWKDVELLHVAEGGIRGELHSNKSAFLEALSRWNASVNPSNSFLCIYSHAGAPGIGPEPKYPSEDVIEWQELAAALPKGVQYLWLVGCKTQEALKKWQPLQGPVLHRLLATDAKFPWLPFLKCFAAEISLEPITFDDEMRTLLLAKHPDLAAHTNYFGPDLQPLP